MKDSHKKAQTEQKQGNHLCFFVAKMALGKALKQ
jgi:hypothetical protein